MCSDQVYLSGTDVLRLCRLQGRMCSDYVDIRDGCVQIM